MKRILLLVLLLAPVALTGCQTIKAHNPFRHKQPVYKSAQQEQPLEVPPDMDQPPTSEALAIPGTGTASPAAHSTIPPEAAAPPPVAGSGGASSGATGHTSFVLADTPDSAWHRVGLALERGEIGKVTAQDDAAHTYQVAVESVVTRKSEGGFFHRLFHRDENETVTGTVTVSVAPQGNGSVVEATGNPDAAARVVALLKQRLK